MNRVVKAIGWGVVLYCCAGPSGWAASAEKESAAPGAKPRTEPAAAADWTAPGGKPAQGLGQLLIRDVQSGSPVRLSVARYHAHVVLQPPVALVQIDQSFYNPYDRQEEGTFLFSLPRGASVSRFAMYVTPQQLVEGELIERQQASNVYEAIVRQRLDPAILEQVGENLFKMRVFPIFPKSTKRILLDFTLPLELDRGECQFRLPLLSDLKPIWDFRLTGSIVGPTLAQSIASSSHPKLVFRPAREERFTFELQEQNYRPETDFAVSFAQDEKPVALRSYTAEPLPPRKDEQGRRIDDPDAMRSSTYFRATFAPASESASAKAEASGADVLVLVDTSSGMRDCGLLRQAVQKIAGALRPADRFRILAVDVAARAVHKGWCVPGSPEAAAALSALEREFFLGGTDLTESFAQSLGEFESQPAPRRRVVLYVGDGEDNVNLSAEKDDWDSLPGRFRKARAALFGVLVRRDASAQPLGKLAHASGGTVFDVAGNLRARRDLVAWLSAGMNELERIERVEVEGASEKELFYPAAVQSGQRITVLGRTAARRTVSVEVRTVRDGKQHTYRQTFRIRPEYDDVFLGRLWAQRQIDRLRAEETAARTDATGFRQRMLALSQEWSLLTPYTAFLVLESEDDYLRWKIDRQQRRRYWSPPDGRAPSPLPEQWTNMATPPGAGLESARVEEEKRLAAALRLAREALAAGQGAAAQQLLDVQRGTEAAAASREYRELTRQALAAVERETLFNSLGLQRALFDPSRRVEQALVPNPWRLLDRSAGMTGEFLRRHPYARQLLQEVRLSVRGNAGELPSVEEVIRMLRALPGVNLVVHKEAREQMESERSIPRLKAREPDKQPEEAPDPFGGDAPNPFSNALVADAAGEGNGTRKPWSLAKEEEKSGVPGWGRLSLRSLARFVLQQHGLALVEEPHRLLIVTPEQAESRLTTEVYPVADLLYPGRTTKPALLADPYFDRRLAAEQRIKAKLARPMTLDFKEKPLHEVLDRVAKALDDTVLIDNKALQEAGVELDAKLSASWNGVPARHSLRWMLEERGLDYYITEEALVVSTPEQIEQLGVVRLHSGIGLVYETPALASGAMMQGWGMGGFGMGMGGMAMAGGGMGGMGGGMGGMGGGMGGMGGTFGGQTPFVVSVAPVADGMGTPADPFSSGGDPSLAPERPPEIPDSIKQDSTRGIGAQGFAPQPFGQGAMNYDIDSISDVVTSTVQPTTWDSVGGPGTLQFFHPTLDFVINTTDSIHDEIEALFERLRRLPPEVGKKSGWRPATIPSQTASERPEDLDFDSLIDLITSTVDVTSWDTVGGPGSIAPDLPRAALIVAATGDMHDNLTRLLVMLRRSRYAAIHKDRPWAAPALTSGGPLLEVLADIEAGGGPRLARLPSANAETLALLKTRRETDGEGWRVEWLRDGRQRPAEISLQRTGMRLEARLPEFFLRTEGDAAAIAYPGMGLAELGPWGESARQFLDAQLPWLPHRTNEQLSRLFHVRRMEAKDGGPANLVELRLVPRGFAESSGTWLDVAFSEKDGLPERWESWMHGKPSARLRFSERAADGPPRWQTVVLEDAAGTPLARWRRLAAPRHDATVPPLVEGWPGYVCLDRRAAEPTVDRPLWLALVALQDADWPAAMHHLDAGEKAHPRHALLAVLRAWCYEQDRRIAQRGPLLSDLRAAASDGKRAVLRLIAGEGLTWLEPAERYELLSLQPKPLRGAADWENLARAALAADRDKEALEHALAARDVAESDGRQFERERLCVELLLRLDRVEEAAKAAHCWAERALKQDDQGGEPGAAPSRAVQDDVRPGLAEQYTAMVALFRRHWHQKQADALFALALSSSKLTVPDRCMLLCRRAELHDGLPRWELLLEAAQLAPAKSALREQGLQRLLAELHLPAQAEIAGQLAGRVKDADLRRELLLQQAELTRDSKVKAEVFLQLLAEGLLPDTRLDAACRAWNQAGRHDQVLRVCEERLRARKPLDRSALVELAAAYAAAGRPDAALRAQTSDPAPPPMPTAPMRARGGGFF